PWQAAQASMRASIVSGGCAVGCACGTVADQNVRVTTTMDRPRRPARLIRLPRPTSDQKDINPPCSRVTDPAEPDLQHTNLAHFAGRIGACGLPSFHEANRQLAKSGCNQEASERAMDVLSS